MRRVRVIGVGLGEPAQLTGEAVAAIRSLDVVLTLEKAGPGDLGAVRRALVAAAAGDRPGGPPPIVDAPDPPRDRRSSAYEGAVDAWTDARAATYAGLLQRAVPDGATAGLLAWGDPAFYDSTLRVLEGVAAAGLALDVDVVPGVSSVAALAAAHRISLTRVGRPLVVTTGRRLRSDGWPPAADDVVVMLDGGDAFRSVDPAGVHVHWGAHLASPDQVLVAGPLADVADDITAARQAARARRGWVMDIYLLRRV
ncbi:MAG TPA: precorrin-6A synthase (deacetylating) [Acidimicrobiales bacterium]|nr:precorrin-6A synthase (deacetylating) [Acidimicrobiales bacterium]